MINFSKVKSIFWDFDGVILDSMSIRDEGFTVVLDQYPKEQVFKLLVYHRENGGLSRYVKFRYFFEEIRGESITEDQIKILAAKFSTVMLSKLARQELFIKDSLNFIKSNFMRFSMHIVSGSDQQELRQLCSTLKIDSYFKSIYGSPTPKGKLVADLLESVEFNKDEVILIGDSKNDLEAASDNGISFYGYNNPSLFSLSSTYIQSFQNVEV